MKIQGFREIIKIPSIETFNTKTFDNRHITLHIRPPHITIESNEWVLGHTTDHHEAFQKFNSLSVYTLDEAIDYIRKGKA